MKLNVIITGVTGMVGEGVLHECLLDERVESVLSISRNPSGIKHSKLKEIIHNDFMDISAIESKLQQFNACFFCMGVSSLGKSEEEYYNLTFNLTSNFAKTLSTLNPLMTFCYVSGAGTDSTEQGKYMWARVKGKTENYLFTLPYKQVFAFRPAYIKPIKGLKNTLRLYKGYPLIYPVIKLLFPNYVSTLTDIAKSMITCTLQGYNKNILEVKDINKIAKL